MVDSQNNTEEDSLEENSDLSNEDGLEGHLIDETALDAKGRRRTKIKLRRRVRIKKKSSPKKKAKKLVETVAWVLILAAFIVTLLVMVLQLDLTTRSKKRSIGSNFQKSKIVTETIQRVNNKLC
jgi:hypothetical protein